MNGVSKKLNWNDVPLSLKLATGFVTIAAIVVTWMFSTFETASASEQKWAQHNQALNCRTVYDWQEQIQNYLNRLRFDKSLSSDDKEWIKLQIDQLREKIARVDPKGQCP